MLRRRLVACYEETCAGIKDTDREVSTGDAAAEQPTAAKDKFTARLAVKSCRFDISGWFSQEEERI